MKSIFIRYFLKTWLLHLMVFLLNYCYLLQNIDCCSILYMVPYIVRTVEWSFYIKTGLEVCKNVVPLLHWFGSRLGYWRHWNLNKNWKGKVSSSFCYRFWELSIFVNFYRKTNIDLRMLCSLRYIVLFLYHFIHRIQTLGCHMLRGYWHQTN